MIGERRAQPAALLVGVDGQHHHLAEKALLVTDSCCYETFDLRVLVSDPGPDREV
jgi:hypothetical protein